MHIISECILSVINLHVIKIHIMRGANNCFQAIGSPKEIFVGGGGDRSMTIFENNTILLFEFFKTPKFPPLPLN